MGTIRSALQMGVSELRRVSDDPHLEAAALLGRCIQKPRSYLFAHDDEALPGKVIRQFRNMVRRRRKGEPFAYVAGVREFWSLEIWVNPKVLIPRPDTECLVEALLKVTQPEQDFRMADLGTGSGAIALAVARERPAARILATDQSAPALAIADANIKRLAPGRIETRRSDWFKQLDGESFDVIVSNPPYVAARDPHLKELPFEPRKALVSGRDGLDDLRRLIPDAPGHLTPGGWLLVEHGSEQGPAVRALFAEAGFEHISSRLDLGGNERVTQGQKPVSDV